MNSKTEAENISTAAQTASAQTASAASGAQAGTAVKKKSGTSVKRVAFIGMFGAIAAILMFLEFPIPFIAPAFYQIDFSEVPVLIGTFALGPVAGIVIEFIKIVVHVLIKGSATAGIGDLANFLVGCAFVVPAGIIYKLHKTKKEAVIGMAAGIIFMVIAGSLLNAFVLLPAYAAAFGGMDAIIAAGTAVNGNVTGVLGFVALCVAPFNLMKGVLDSVLTFLLYKRVHNLIKKAGA
jgi:riboflavin transporter FmnP